MITISEPNHYTPIPNTMNDLKTVSDVDTKALEIIKFNKKLKKDIEVFEKMKLTYLTTLMRQNIGAVNIKEGKVVVCTRTTKDFGTDYKNLEANLKAEKARLEHLSEFTIEKVSHNLMVTIY